MAAETSIDYGRLNDAAQTLYDAAFARGKGAGRDDLSHEVVEHVGRGMLGMAAQVLRLAVELPEAEHRTKAALIAGRIYGRTPGGSSFDEGRLAGRFDAVLQKRLATDRVGADIDIAAARETADVLADLAREGA
jgi:hypothetical protein